MKGKKSTPDELDMFSGAYGLYGYYSQGYSSPICPKESDWDSNLETLKDSQCKFHESAPSVRLNISTWQKSTALCRAWKDKEWLAYLLGEYDESSDTFIVKDLIVPEQEVTSTQVEVLTRPDVPNIIGTIHSHHNMGAFFSATDTNFIGANHSVMIVRTNKGEAKCQVRRLMPCGAYLVQDTDFTINYPSKKYQQFVTDSLSRIHEPKPVVNSPWPNGFKPWKQGYVFVAGEGWIDPQEAVSDSPQVVQGCLKGGVA